MSNTNLVPNSRYFINYDIKKYIGTYKETTNLNGTQYYNFEMISEIFKFFSKNKNENNLEEN